MIERKLNIINNLDDSIFLFGARQTGKSTFLRAQFPDSIYINLFGRIFSPLFVIVPVMTVL